MKLEMCNINDYDGIDPFIISDRLMNDEHELVLKGYGWILKSVSQIEIGRASCRERVSHQV